MLHVFNVSPPRNITLTLDEETLREARMLAAQRGKSVSGLLRDELAGLVTSGVRVFLRAFRPV